MERFDSNVALSSRSAAKQKKAHVLQGFLHSRMDKKTAYKVLSPIFTEKSEMSRFFV